MLVVAFIQWWYGPGWRDASNRLAARIQSIYLNFSLPILLRTLFQPWKRITTPPGGSLEQHFRAGIDNLISRAIGFTMRAILLVTACVMIAACAVGGGLLLVLWPILPALGPILIVVGLL